MGINKKYHVIGVMSGTSLDGIDIVKCVFQKKNTWRFKIERTETMKYTKEWSKKLRTLHMKNSKKIKAVNIEYGELLAKKIIRFIKKYSLQVNLIASHGHTIFHQPENRITLQIGCGKTIARRTKIKTITNFRNSDIMLGGQGAPLVPIGDLFLFSKYKYCLNLGGFANVSIKKNKQLFAYDICPANFVLNYLSNKLALEFDYNGEIARKGILDTTIFNKLNQLTFYRESPPKSLSREWVEKEIFPLIQKNTSIINWMHTFVEHIALQIGNILKDKTTLVTGGGALNNYLIKRIQHYSNSKLIFPEETIINFKEAIIFGFLGVLKIRNEINCLSEVTGASKDSSGGEVFEYS